MKSLLVVATFISLSSLIASTSGVLAPAVAPAANGQESQQENLLRSSGNDNATPNGDGESTISQVCKGCRLS